MFFIPLHALFCPVSVFTAAFTFPVLPFPMVLPSCQAVGIRNYLEMIPPSCLRDLGLIGGLEVSII
jgi:hypothetical protein